MSGKKPDCVRCGFIKVIPENFEVMDIVFNYGSFFFDGMGGVNLQNIKTIMDLEGKQDRMDLFSKVLTFTNLLTSAKNKRI